ncbi:MAG: Hsp20/alpha crystallin family protein [Sulfuricurvum sp.]|uniref:Hsp20/alpha crystallin family protein n=1 Tax=Sulfuricurvum sp. TaxID=2025608 RepID=UPI0027348053|nr:Hsp20/alpha crystallin family protein [Sulfuricurvum sp.]MDP2850160.1 Hsp20/alpha crystallin family protein [Sulfuricurvum sp.]
MKIFISSLLAVGFSAASLFASNASASTPQKCEFGCPFWEIEEMENFFNRPIPRMSSMYSAARMKESNKAYLISIDLPGMDKKDISIETSGNRLMISGERKEESESKEGSKKSYRRFNQSFSLPDDANLEAISATSTNGVLKITVPKTGKKVSKKIEIK